ncbi:hypothetical protein BGZ54_005679 [Gamsiella multidivaricata]|nr:hypothetical protein BGZ54_005679 [Gamsiella multidivaricata]
MIVPGQQQSAINRVGNNWFGSFFGRTTTPPLPSSERHDSNTIALEHVRISISSESTPDGLHPSPSDPATLREQESAAATAADQEDDEEAGCYHLREESLTGTTGRIVAVYRPGRPANRALDRPAMSKRLEIFTELGEKCETALMLMCVRLDDLFMAIPDDKKGSFTDPVAVQRNGGRSGNGSEGAGGGEDTTEQGGETEGGEPGGRESGTGEGEDDRRSEISVMKRLLGGRHTWRLRIKWVIATILVAVVIVLILKPKFSQSS